MPTVQLKRHPWFKAKGFQEPWLGLLALSHLVTDPRSLGPCGGLAWDFLLTPSQGECWLPLALRSSRRMSVFSLLFLSPCSGPYAKCFACIPHLILTITWSGEETLVTSGSCPVKKLDTQEAISPLGIHP